MNYVDVGGEIIEQKAETVSTTTEHQKIRVGIVGARPDGFRWGSIAHMPALRALDEYDVVAVAATSQGTADAAAEAHGIPMAFGNYGEMVRRDDIDLICVTTNMMTHHGLVMEAIEASKDVFCEWPLGASTREAAEMRDAAERRGVRTLIGLQSRCSPTVAYVRDLISQGYIGDVMSVVHQRANDQTSRIKLPQSYLYIVDRARGNAGINILAGHSVDVLDAYVGAFVDVQAFAEVLLKEATVEETGEPYEVTAPDHVLIQGRLGNGAVATAHMTMTSAMNRPFHLEISGSKGLIVVTSTERLPPAERQPGIPSDLEIYGLPGQDASFERLEVPERYSLVPEDTPQGQPYNVAHLYRLFSDAVRNDVPHPLGFDHAVRMHRLLDDVSSAADSGRRVEVRGG